MLPGLALAAVIAYALGAVVWHANPPVVPVAGVSMRPALQPGDLVVLTGVDPQRLRAGEVVAFAVPGPARSRYGLPGHLVHRIVKVEHTPAGLVFQTKGDANPGPDVFVVPSGDITGRMVTRLPGLGYPLLFFHSRQGLIFLAALAAVVVVYFLLGLLEERRAYVETTAAAMGRVLAEIERLSAAVAPPPARAPPPPDGGEELTGPAGEPGRR